MASIEPGPLSREADLSEWADRLHRRAPQVYHLFGPEGTGKTELLCAVLRRFPGPSVHVAIPPLEEAALLEVVETEARERLGSLEPPDRPDLLPLPGLGARWSRLLEGILLRLASGAGVLVLDGFDELLSARRRIAGELSEVWTRMARRELPVHLVLVSRTPDLPSAFMPGSADEAAGSVESVRLGAVSYRAAGWAHGAIDPVDAFRRWAVFGHHAAHLPRRPAPPSPRDGGPESLADAVLRRILHPDGDLFDAPLARLSGTVTAPARYAGILSAVAARDRDWSGMAETLGVGRGSHLAPYIHRLETDGFLRVRLPLDAPPGSRRRRYAPADPFLSFWFGLVLPLRSRLLRDSPTRVWRESIEPALPAHLDRWLPEAARLWLREHATEVLPAPARITGGIWGAEAEVPIAGHLTNGQVCYGITQVGNGLAGPELMKEVRDRMARTRFGIGRQARAPLIFLQGESDAELRREVARDPLAHLLSPMDLMGAGPPRG